MIFLKTFKHFSQGHLSFFPSKPLRPRRGSFEGLRSNYLPRNFYRRNHPTVRIWEPAPQRPHCSNWKCGTWYKQLPGKYFVKLKIVDAIFVCYLSGCPLRSRPLRKPIPCALAEA